MPDEPVVDAPPPAADAPPPPAEPLTPEAEEAALDAQLEADAIPLPDGTDKLVPLAAVTTLRGKLKDARAELATARTGGDKAAQLEATIADLNAQLADARPLADAYRVFARVAPEHTTEDKAATAADQAELEEIARDELYYDNAGALDIARAERHRGRIRKEAERIAEARVGPMQQQQVSAASRGMLASAKLTAAPNGQKPDPAILDELWGRVDPSLTATKAGAIQVWNAALGMTVATGKGAAPARAPLPTPLVIEKAGGRDTPAPVASDGDKRAARDLGMTVEAYLKEAGDMPWGKK